MGLMGKICRELLCNRVKLALLFSFILLLLLYSNACNLGLSTNCPTHPSSSTDYRLSGQLIIDLHQKLKSIGPSASSKTKSDNHVGGNHGDHDNEAEHSDNADAPQADDGQHELEEPVEERRRQTDMKGLNLNNWDLDRFYSVPRGTREQQKSVQQEPNADPIVLPKPAIEPIKKLEDIPKANDDSEIDEKPVKADKIKVHVNDIGKDNPVVVAKKKIFVDQQSPPDEQAGILRGKDQLYVDSPVEQIPKKDLNPPGKPVPKVMEKLNPPGERMPNGKKGSHVKPPNELKKLNPPDAGMLRTEDNQKPMDAYLKRKVEKKYKKKVIHLLPDTFPYFENHRPPARIGDYTCRDGLCSEFLDDKDQFFYKECVSRMKISKNLADQDHAPGDCHFINGAKRSAVALVSFPGSGNTWARGLLERATGVCTGSVYCDNVLRVSGMNGESVRSGAVLVVKTHKPFPTAWTDEDKPRMSSDKPAAKMPAYGAAILIVRNPFNALVAEWSRTVSADKGHTGQVNQSVFGENPYWDHFITDRLAKWQDFLQFWVVGRKDHRVLVIRYEDLKNDVEGSVIKMLDFLKYPYNEMEVKKKLSEDFGTFKRKHKEEFEHFTEEQKKVVRFAIEESIDYLQQNNNGNTFGIEEYLL